MSTDQNHSAAWNTLRSKTSKVQEISLDEIYIDPRFQRPLNATRVKAIQEDYHSQGVGLLVVAKVDDHEGYACVDGQTRLRGVQAARAEEGNPKAVPATVRAEVYEELTPEEAALLFRLRNFQVVVPLYQRNRIALTEGDPLIKEAARQVEMAGYTMFDTPEASATLLHVEVAKRLVRRGQRYNRPDLLGEALLIQANAYGTDLGAVDKAVLEATANLMRKNPDLDEAEFTDLLREQTVPKILAQAELIRIQQGKRLVTATEIYLAAQYNAQIKGQKAGKIRQ